MTEMVTEAEWIAALRSGEYEQTEGALCRVDSDGSKGYCCLGVYMDLLEKRGLAKSNLEEENGGNGMVLAFSVDDGDSEQAILPYAVAKNSFFPDGNPNINGMKDSVAELNDGGMTFNEIADLVETKGLRDRKKENNR